MDGDRVEPREWVRALAHELGIEVPSTDEVDDLLSLAGTAAHAAERWVAPVSTWLTARAALPPDAARALVERLATSMTATADPSGATSGTPAAPDGDQ